MVEGEGGEVEGQAGELWEVKMTFFLFLFFWFYEEEEGRGKDEDEGGYCFSLGNAGIEKSSAFLFFFLHSGEGRKRRSRCILPT